MRPLIGARAALIACLCIAGCAAGAASSPRSREPVIGLPCEGCEIVFEGLPDSLSAHARLGPPDEPGEPMRIAGIVLDATGMPAPGVIVYAYHTNARGIYPTTPDGRSTRHGRLRGWAMTDAEGRYAFTTIRPEGYPDSSQPAHVHMHVIEVGCCTYFIDDILFDDDPRLTPRMREQLTAGRGGSGVVTPVRDDAGVWIVTRDIRLGAGIPGHPGPDAAP